MRFGTDKGINVYWAIKGDFAILRYIWQNYVMFFYVRNVDACEKYRINYVGDLLLFADVYVSFVMDKRISKV